MKTKLLLAVSSILVLFTLSSCLQVESTISLKKDGSGTVTEDLIFGEQMVQMMKMGMAQAAQADGKAKDPFAEMLDKKKAVEQFWISISGDENRAKNMIKLYYNRVQNANINFTADREGWMTDRGMIYIIYGTPDVVYRDQYMETWQYGNYKNNKAITFNFYKVNNPFTTNLYVMQRNEEYKYSWMKAVSVWRK